MSRLFIVILLVSLVTLSYGAPMNKDVSNEEQLPEDSSVTMEEMAEASQNTKNGGGSDKEKEADKAESDSIGESDDQIADEKTLTKENEKKIEEDTEKEAKKGEEKSEDNGEDKNEDEKDTDDKNTKEEEEDEDKKKDVDVKDSGENEETADKAKQTGKPGQDKVAKQYPWGMWPGHHVHYPHYPWYPGVGYPFDIYGGGLPFPVILQSGDSKSSSKKKPYWGLGGYGYGYGHGHGHGNGHGHGYGHGNGYGHGYGFGHGVYGGFPWGIYGGYPYGR